MTILHDIKNVESQVSDNPLVAHHAYGRRKANKSSKNVRPSEFRNIAHARAFGGPQNITHQILKIIRAAQPISRIALARRLGINRSTITVLVKPLLHAGVLHEGRPEQSTIGRIGRPPIGLSLCAKNEFFIGVNIGVQHIQIGAITVGDQQLSEESFATLHEPMSNIY